MLISKFAAHNKSINQLNINQMKKIIFLLTFLIWIPSIHAQITQEQAENEVTDAYKKACILTQENKFKEVETIYSNILSKIDSYPENIRKEISESKPALYYMLTSAQAQLNKKKNAIESFDKAIKLGWSQYYDTVNDSTLNNLKKEKKFIALMKILKYKGDFNRILKEAGDYNNKIDNTSPKFTYLAPNDSNLVKIREYFNLDSIAGSGNEISKIKNLLLWAHNAVRHDGDSTSPKVKNAIALVEVCKKENRGINCRMMAQLLNECYLAMGFKARYVTAMPKVYTCDCHVINTVYSNTLNKWIWVDPTYNAYLADENGKLLSIEEVRERIRTDKTIVVNEDANYNNKKKIEKEFYIDYYMTKNLYYIECVLNTGYDTETVNGTPNRNIYISLYPSSAPEIVNNKANATDNATYFWQAPQQ